MKKTAVVIFMLGLSACVSMETMRHQWQAQACNQDSAYSQGFNDAREGKRMNASYAGACPAPTQVAVRAGYNRGFKEGLEAMREEKPLISVNIGGRATASNGWFCEMSMFGKHYRAFGSTRLEAQQKILDQCAADGNEFHCRHRDADCTINR